MLFIVGYLWVNVLILVDIWQENYNILLRCDDSAYLIQHYFKYKLFPTLTEKCEILDTVSGEISLMVRGQLF